MNITFVFPDWAEVESTVEQNKKGHGIGHYNFAVGTLAAVLKEKGHKVDLLHICYPPQEKEFKELLASYESTEVFAFTFTSVEKEWVHAMNQWIKEELGTFTIGGGIYPTLCPEFVLQHMHLDAVCIGEGELALSTFCEKLEQQEEYTHIQNLWFNQNGTIKKNATGQIIENLDSLPRYDFDVFDPHRIKQFVSNLPRLYYLCTRNCPYGCTFCSNQAKKMIFRCGSQYVRRFSPDRVISDLEYYLQKFPRVQLVHFADEIIHFDRRWFEELMTKYKEKIGLPWRSYAMLKNVDRDIAKIMAWSGCTRVNCGIEAGSARIRNIYNRPHVTNEEMVSKVAMLQQNGIDVHTSALLNAPTETLDEMLATIKLAARVNTDIAVVGIVVPYEGTRLYDLVRHKSLLKEVIPENLGVSIKPIDCSEEKVLFLFHAYRLLVEIYKFLYKQSPGIQHVFIPFIDSIVKSEKLPHRLLIKIRKNFFQGKLLNLAYRRVEKKIGRKERAYSDIVQEEL